jgi:hypothetical protein
LGYVTTTAFWGWRAREAGKRRPPKRAVEREIFIVRMVARDAWVVLIGSACT